MNLVLKKGDKKLIRSWAFYDWANSVYSLVISTAIFPIYYNSVTGGDDSMVEFFGFKITNIALYDYALSFSFLIVALISPILSSIADYTGQKKFFMKVFCTIGSVSVAAMFWFEDASDIYIAIFATVFACIGFWGSLVFYNAYLPEIAYPEQQDDASAKGFIYGYTGSILLLSFNLSMQLKPELYGITDSTLPARISFLSVAIWWFVFAQIAFRRLPDNEFKKKRRRNFMFKGYQELKIVINEIKHLKALKIYLISFFLFSVGVQTIILIAAIYGSQELGLPTGKLIITILLVQIVGIFGAFLFSKISKKLGNLKALRITIVCWAIISLGAYMLDKSHPDVELHFFILGGALGLVMGAIQSLSRSTYSKMIPENSRDNVTYFSFFDVTEKIAIVAGTFIFGSVVLITGSMKISILVLALFFVVSYITILFIPKTKYVS
ncbi:MAG: MFS transporter [Flavobacteriaceae bacterium]|nr:MFS transporter [Flavobacteriaceae bacterium]